MFNLFNSSMYEKEQIPEDLQGILLEETNESGSERSEDDDV